MKRDSGELYGTFGDDQIVRTITIFHLRSANIQTRSAKPTHVFQMTN